MRVVIVSCVYPPEPVTSAQTSEQVATKLAAQGQDVVVLTNFPNRPSGRIFPGFKRSLYKKEKHPAGYMLIRCFSTISSKSNLLSRILENLSFGVSSGIAALLTEHPDVIYSNTWPILASGILEFIAHIRHIPIVISIQDIYPESLISQQRLSKNNFFVKLIRSIDRTIAKGCSSLIVISEHFRDVYIIDRSISENKIHMIPNWISKDSVVPITNDREQIRSKFHLPSDAFVLVYGGNVGTAAGVESVIEAYKEILDISNLYLLIAGDGPQLDKCKEIAKSLPLDRVRFHSPWPSSETSEVLGLADVLVLPTRGNQTLASMPSKLIPYMLAARPLIATVHEKSDTAKVISESGCGWFTEPDQPKFLAELICLVKNLPMQELYKRGQAGREYALNHFTAEANLPKVINVITQAASRITFSTEE